MGAVLNIDPVSFKVEVVQFTANTIQGKASKPALNPFY
jgi:hypothetical protein